MVSKFRITLLKQSDAERLDFSPEGLLLQKQVKNELRASDESSPPLVQKGWKSRGPEEEARSKKKSSKLASDAEPELDEKIGEAIQEKMKGGAIRKAKKRSPKKDIKIQEAIATKMQSGGAIRKPKKKSPRKNQKVDEAIAAKMQGGKLRFHDATHKYLHQKLSGRGGRLDPPFVREKMHQLMSAYHPAIFQSYLTGKVRDIPSDPHYDLGGPPRPTRIDPRPTVVDTGGSMAALTHSENGLLQAFDSTFYNHFELV
jgi:hypothetical protein